MTTKYTGKIILLDRIRNFGFIECSELALNIFFSKRNALEWDSLEIFDSVQFYKNSSTDPKHIGKLNAVRVTLIENADTTIETKFGEIDRWAGSLEEWDGEKGYVTVPTLSKRIFLKHTTLAYHKVSDARKGDLLVVCPVKSTNPLSDYFARFAYPLSRETEVSFLEEAWGKNDSEVIWAAIGDRIRHVGHISRLWHLRCRSLKDIPENERLQLIVQQIDQFQPWGYEPSLEDIMEATGSDESLLLTLWLREKTNHYQEEQVLSFFINASDDWRAQILNRLTAEKQVDFLTQYIQHLAKKDYLKANTPRLRYVLQTAKRLGKDVQEPILAVLKNDLENLPIEDKMQLWVKGLLVDLDLSNWLDQINFENTAIIRDIICDKSAHREKLTQIILDHFLNKIHRKNFGKWYPYLIPVLQIVEKDLPELALTVRRKIEQKLSPVQILTMGLLGLKSYLKDDYSFLETDWGKWPMYALVRYVLTKYDQAQINSDQIRSVLIAHAFSGQRLQEEIPSLPWSQVLQPCRKEPKIDYEIGYIEDIDRVCDLAKFQDIKIIGEASLSTRLFESNRPMKAFHARLWLNEYVPRSYYDYYGFREPYKGLSMFEKRAFTKPSQEMMEGIVDVQVISEIPPCNDFKEEGAVRVYSAKLRNIHFKNGAYRLKTPDGFTHFKSRDGVTYGLNFVSGNRTLHTIIFEIRVSANRIVDEKGIDQLLNEITRENLVSSIGRNGARDASYTDEEPAYTDDLILQEQILHYLRSKQEPEHTIILVNPHVFEYEVSEDDKLKINHTNVVTGIFTIKLTDAYILVWEFYNLTSENATYIFKVGFDNYDKIVDRLTKVISTRSGVRAALNTSKALSPKKLLEDFRRGLGYVANFKIKRGDTSAFKLWKKKLEEKFQLPTPVYVSDDEWSDALNKVSLQDSRTTPSRTTKVKNTRRSGIGKPSSKEDDKVQEETSDLIVKIGDGPTKPGVKDPPEEVRNEKETVAKMKEINAIILHLLKKTSEHE